MKILIVFCIPLILVFCTLAQDSFAQEQALPPLLKGQSVPPSPPPSPPPVESAMRPVPAGPPTAGPAPPPVGAPAPQQTVPVQEIIGSLGSAVNTAQKINGHLRPGNVWTVVGPAGEVEIKAGLLYQDTVVAVLHFDPVDGSVLPLGIHPRVGQSNPQIQSIQADLATLTSKLRIIPYAQFREPEACWLFPITLGNSIVTNVKIYYDGLHVVPDYPADQEMRFYGKR